MHLVEDFTLLEKVDAWNVLEISHESRKFVAFCDRNRIKSDLDRRNIITSNLRKQ